MRKIIYVFILFLFACGKSPKLITTAKPLKKLVLEESYQLIKNVNFLFVLDTSGSMKTFREDMTRNFQYFLPIIKDYPHYEYNFAVTTMSPVKVFDNSIITPFYMMGKSNVNHSVGTNNVLESKSFKEVCKIGPDRFLKTSHLGSYFQYKFSKAKSGDFKNFMCLLSHNINNAKGHQDGGDEWYFSALDFIMRTDTGVRTPFFDNNGLLVILFLSDAVGDLAIKGFKNTSLGNPYRGNPYRSQPNRQAIPLNIDVKVAAIKKGIRYGLNQFNRLIDYKGDSNIRAYGVIPREPKESSSCGEATYGVDKVNTPVHVYNFIEKTSGKYFSICDGSNWGKDLTVISEDLKEILKIQNFFLEEVPLISTIKVFYNNNEIPNDLDKGWYYDPETISIKTGVHFTTNEFIGNKDNLEGFRIEYHPLNPQLYFMRESK